MYLTTAHFLLKFLFTYNRVKETLYHLKQPIYFYCDCYPVMQSCVTTGVPIVLPVLSLTLERIQYLLLLFFCLHIDENFLFGNSETERLNF